MISVILNAYDVDKAQRHQTMQCMADLRKYTDCDFELIVIDNIGTHRLRDDFGVLAPYTYVLNEENQTVYHCYHQGAELAKGEIFVFIQNDVYVHERCLDKLTTYLETYEMAFPQQIPLSRANVKQIYTLHDGEVAEVGQRDAGLLMITRDAYFRAGGWDTRFRNLLGEKAFYKRCEKAQVSWIDRTNAFVSHIMAGNNLRKEEALYNAEMDYDAHLIGEFY